MRKIYIITFSLLLIVFIYYGFTVLNDAIPKATYSFSHILNSTSNSGDFLFKSSPENEDLINAMLNIHTEFTNNPPIKHTEIENDIKNFYKIKKLFPSFNSYYLAKIKITNALYNELDNLENNIKNLSEEQLNTYFVNNTKYLDKNWGITDFNEFTHLVDTVKLKASQKAISCELEESYFYVPDSNITNFRIIINLENQEKIYIGALASFSEKTAYQTSPVIRFYGTQGGMS